VGLYSFPDAARIIGVKPNLLRRWATDYYYISNGKEYRHYPVIPRRFDSEGPLTFVELIEFVFIKLFYDYGVSIPTIRRASEYAAALFNTPYPFTVRRFDTDGYRIFATLGDKSDEEQSFIAELTKGQLAFENVVHPFFVKIEYASGLENAVRYWPMKRSGRVVLDPQRAFGKPIDDETGIPTEVIFDALRSQSAKEVADWFEIPEEAVIAADRYERLLSNGTLAVPA